MLVAIKYIFSEHFNNAARIWGLAKNTARKQVIRTTLGMGWIYLRDLIYFLTFVFVRFLLAGDRHADGIKFIPYLVVGLITWFFMSDVINASPHSIKGNKTIVNSFSFPITILPTIDVVAIFLKRAFSIGLIFLIAWAYGYASSIKPLLFLYYYFSMLMMMVAFSLVFSSIGAISTDFSQLYDAFTRILIYTVPIIWSFDQIPDGSWVSVALKANPLTYIIIGVRSAVLGGSPNSWEYLIYFWCCFLLLLFIGSFLQFKLRRYYADFV